MQRLTKKHIKEVIRTGTLNDVFKLASLKGYDLTDSFLGLSNFLRDYNATKKRTLSLKSDLVIIQLGRIFKGGQKGSKLNEAIKTMKYYKGDTSNHRKVLMQYKDNILWCSPMYGLTDYNSSLAMPLNERNLRVMELVNSVLDRHYKLSSK